MVKIKIVKRTTPFKIRDPKTTYSEYINDFQNRVAWIIKIKITYIFEKYKLYCVVAVSLSKFFLVLKAPFKEIVDTPLGT